MGLSREHQGQRQGPGTVGKDSRPHEPTMTKAVPAQLRRGWGLRPPPSLYQVGRVSACWVLNQLAPHAQLSPIG